MPKYKVLLTSEMDERGKRYLEEHDCELIIGEGHQEQCFLPIIEKEQVDAIMTRTDEITAKMIDASSNLKVIAKHGVGLDNIDMDHATEKGVQVVFAPMDSINSVAEHALMLLLMCARRYEYVEETFRNGDFDVRYQLKNTFELRGMTLGLLGCGHIGQAFAKKAVEGLEMKVIGYDPYMTPEKLKAPITLVSTPDEVFEESDFVSIHLPKTPKTVHSIGMAQFKKMKKTASLINCARGSIIVEEDLMKALNEGVLLGAGVDVFEEEPIRNDHPFFTMPQVNMTPHVAATTEQAVGRTCLIAAKGIVEVFEGKELSFPANHL